MHNDTPRHVSFGVTKFETFFERIVQRNFTLSDVPGLAAVASAAGMDILGPPLNDEEVAAIVREQRI
jgi:hypothetical protein